MGEGGVLIFSCAYSRMHCPVTLIHQNIQRFTRRINAKKQEYLEGIRTKHPQDIKTSHHAC